MKYNLSEVNNLIRSRRTIKPEYFTSRKIHKEIIDVLLENARWAPTHGLTQPWYFKIFFDKGIDRLSDAQSHIYKEITPQEEFNQLKYDQLKSRPKLASVIIGICMKRQISEKIPEIEEVEAVACAVHNMQLTATAFGLGAYWGTGGVTYSDQMKQFLGLSVKDKCLGFLYVGYPSVAWPKSQRKATDSFTDWIID